MTEISREELLKWLDKCWSLRNTSIEEWERVNQAYQQIRQLIEQSEPCFSPVPEEGIEEKAEKGMPNPIALKQAIEAYEKLKRGEK